MTAPLTDARLAETEVAEAIQTAIDEDRSPNQGGEPSHAVWNLVQIAKRLSAELAELRKGPKSEEVEIALETIRLCFGPPEEPDPEMFQVFSTIIRLSAALAEAERQLSEYLQSPQDFIRTLQDKIRALQPQQNERCHADRDGDCNWSGCPQLNEQPRRSHCRLDDQKERT